MKALEFLEKENKLKFINQTLLPFNEEYVITDDYERIALAIERLEIRGAPAIGIAASYAVALSVKHHENKDKKIFADVIKRLRKTRPTAVNLFWALEIMEEEFLKASDGNLFNILLAKAKNLHKDDIRRCNLIAENGLKIFRKKSIVLTHCNTGFLATGGEGTALNVIKKAFANDLIELVYVDETRPLLQGSRLTAFELDKANIPFKIITDSMAAFVLKNYDVDLVIVGADRITSNGDSANKIGSYNLAIASAYHNVPFYIAAPKSTIDNSITNGSEIRIEYRDKEEIIKIGDTNITRSDYDSLNPSFDVVPSNLISGIITEESLWNFPYKF